VCRVGNLKILRGLWNEDLCRVLEGFPDLAHDDEVDACRGALEMLNPEMKARGLFEFYCQEAERVKAERAAGAFGGGTLNAPLINYYEHGTFLTLNHAHTALFGAFGLLAIGLIYFCLRYATADRAPFGEALGVWAFWLYNGGLVLWIALNFFPIGWPQLVAVYEHGLACARSMTFYDTTLLWQWMRLPGDVVFALGALLMAWDFTVRSRPLLPQSVGR
jgi:nitric oxide reductase large subunit